MSYKSWLGEGYDGSELGVPDKFCRPVDQPWQVMVSTKGDVWLTVRHQSFKLSYDPVEWEEGDGSGIKGAVWMASQLEIAMNRACEETAKKKRESNNET